MMSCGPAAGPGAFGLSFQRLTQLLRPEPLTLTLSLSQCPFVQLPLSSQSCLIVVAIFCDLSLSPEGVGTCWFGVRTAMTLLP